MPANGIVPDGEYHDEVRTVRRDPLTDVLAVMTPRGAP
jgi:hypothetical protein